MPRKAIPMTSVWVVVVLCMTGHPGVCQEQLLDEPQTMAMCAVAGEQYAAGWLDEHPAWQLERVKCSPGNLPPSVNKGEI
jgi:hypothetical protein